MHNRQLETFKKRLHSADKTSSIERDYRWLLIDNEMVKNRIIWEMFQKSVHWNALHAD